MCVVEPVAVFMGNLGGGRTAEKCWDFSWNANILAKKVFCFFSGKKSQLLVTLIKSNV